MSADAQHTCDECRESFATLTKLRLHDCAPATGAIEWSCPECRHEHRETGEMADRIRTDDDVKAVRCSQCGRAVRPMEATA